MHALELIGGGLKIQVDDFQGELHTENYWDWEATLEYYFKEEGQEVSDPIYDEYKKDDKGVDIHLLLGESLMVSRVIGYN